MKNFRVKSVTKKEAEKKFGGNFLKMIRFKKYNHKLINGLDDYTDAKNKEEKQWALEEISYAKKMMNSIDISLEEKDLSVKLQITLVDGEGAPDRVEYLEK